MQPFSADMSRKQWSKESMAAALQDVRGGMSVQEAAKLYNLPFETLRRVVGKVDLECKSGPPTVLTEHEEDELASYCVKMSDMGFGLTIEDLFTGIQISDDTAKESSDNVLCPKCGLMRVHLDHESALGCLRVHLDVWPWSAFG